MRLKNLTCLTLAFCAATAHAQTATGFLRGVVQDTGAARVVAATIENQPSDSSLIRKVFSDNHGEFQISQLNPGLCQVKVEARGFTTASAAVSISVSTIRDVTVILKPASVHQTVRSPGAGLFHHEQRIDLASNVLLSVVTSQDLEGLPLPARSFANIAYLAPGTEPVEPSDPTL